MLNRHPIGIGFAEAANEGTRYFNRRAEMYFGLAEWIRKGGALPPQAPELITVLPQITYTFKGDRLLLEPKELVEAKIGTGNGLDESDALALTFASPVAPRMTRSPFSGNRQRDDRYDPYSEFLR